MLFRSNIIFGAVINEDLKDELIITVIATGFENKKLNPLKTITKKPDNVDPNNKEADIQANQDDLDIPTFLRRKR